jgi:hypothetical protein
VDNDGEQLEYDQSGGGQRGEDGAIPVSQGRMSPVAPRISTLPMKSLPLPGREGTHPRGRSDDLVIAQSIEMTSLPRVPAANCSIASPVCSRL